MPGIKELVAQAEAEISTIDVETAKSLMQDPGVLLVDLRDIRELWREGRIPGSFHAPRGMLEFWLDPESPYHKDVFSAGKRLVFYCNKGWRSALAAQTAQNMGFDPVCHIGGGFAAWVEAAGPVEEVKRK